MLHNLRMVNDLCDNDYKRCAGEAEWEGYTSFSELSPGLSR